ncbi:hypothetical protein [Nocardioides sp. 1609]|uniref:hypothetical protein n=1 Tax=Nocardioides sp. 1609 TaxID=2508327 RepID=UPI00106FCB9C|nr:hypothetical protein [Nocardioides sp. 1609]
MTYQPLAPPTVRYRPRKRWFAVGALLLVLAGVVFVGGLYVVLHPLTQEDAVVEVGAGPVEVDLPPGEERGLFVRDGEPVECTAVDADGAPVELRTVSGTFTVGDWTADHRFDTGAGDVTFACTSVAADAEARIGALPSTGSFVGGLLVTVLVPLALGLGGLVLLIVVGILYAVRPARPTSR